MSTLGNPPKRKRSDISSLSRQQQWSRKKQLHTDLNQALLFLDQEGVSASSIILKYDETNESESLDLETGTYSKQASSSSNNDDINEAILYVKDRFGLSDTAYHELSMICQKLPRSCKLTELCHHLNSQWEIKPCPGNHGVQQSLSVRLQERTKHLIKSNKINSGDVLRVKLSGDGTKICRKLNLINFTFTLLNEGDTAMSPKGNHTIAIINGTENYDHLKMSLSDIIKEVEQLKSLTINGITFQVTFYFCSDLKFLAIACGIESATATYSCIWCKCPSSERHDMSKQWSISDTQKGARTIEEIIGNHTQSKGKRFGCIHPPLFQTIPITRIIPDTLHLFLRITDVLFNLLITDIRRYDGITKATTSNTTENCTYLQEFEQFINVTCKIPFHFSTNKITKELQWRDLMGPEKHTVLSKINLPETLPNLPNVQNIQDLWKDFKQLYGVLQQQSITFAEANQFEAEAKSWVKKFTAIYQTKNVTPYIHIMAMHIPEFIYMHQNLAQFTQQGLEKLNDQTTIDYARSTNHNHRNLDALKQLLQKKNRMEYLEDNGFQRKPNTIRCSICNSEGHNK